MFRGAIGAHHSPPRTPQCERLSLPHRVKERHKDSMGRFIAKRFLSMLGMMLAASLLVFLLQELTPGSVATTVLGQ